MPIWPFGRKKKTNRNSTQTVSLYPEVRQYMKEVEGRDHFLGDATLNEHFRLTELLDNAPLSQQMEIAQELVSMSSAAKTSFKEQGWKKLPAHRGYYRLAVNFEKDKQYDEAIRAARQAKKEGWAGDWDKRIERCYMKIHKLKRSN